MFFTTIAGLFLQSASARMDKHLLEGQLAFTKVGNMKSDGANENCPIPIRVHVKDFVVDGEYVNKFRNHCPGELERDRRPPCPEIEVWACYENNRSSSCTYISFHHAISSVIQAYSKEKVRGLPERTKKVIKYIFTAWERLGNDDLVDLAIFTSVAMHNMNLLISFTPVDRSNCLIGALSRGLLQIKSKQYYQWLKDKKVYDYILRPWHLDEFSSESIRDEYLLFCHSFAGWRRCNPIVRLAKCIKAMASDESLDLVLTDDVRSIFKQMQGNPKLKRRLDIFVTVYTYITYGNFQ